MTALKTLFAAALAVPLAVAAQDKPAAPPPPPPVQVYGTINVNLQYTEAGGATTATQDVSPRFAIATDSTNIGVRGTLEVKHGLKAMYQCETQANVDGEDTRAICNRNSRVGLSGNFGTVFFGNWDTPYKAATYGTKADDPFGNTDVFGFNGVFGSPGYGARSSAFSGGATASFDQRAANSLAYWSPKFSGVSGKVQISLDETRSADGLVDPLLIAAAVNFDQGGLSVVAAAEYHEDVYGIRSTNAANSGTTASKDMAWKLAAGYELPLGPGNLRVLGMFEQLSYKQDNAAAGFTDYSRMAWLLGASFRAGDHELRLRYTQAMKPSITAVTGTANEDDLGAQNIAAGYAYHLAKSTQLFAFFAQIKNEDRAQYTFGVGGAARIVGANTPAGSDPTAFGFGIRHSF